MEQKKKRYNIEVTIECRTHEDAKNLAAFIFYSGFMPVVDGAIIHLITKNVNSTMLDYLVTIIEDDDRIISSSFHRTPL